MFLSASFNYVSHFVGNAISLARENDGLEVNTTFINSAASHTSHISSRSPVTDDGSTTENTVTNAEHLEHHQSTASIISSKPKQLSPKSPPSPQAVISCSSSTNNEEEEEEEEDDDDVDDDDYVSPEDEDFSASKKKG